MSVPKQFKYLLEEVRVFYRNLQKDNIERRKDIHVIESKSSKLSRLQCELSELVKLFNKEKFDSVIRNEIRDIVESINKYLAEIKNTLESRITEAQSSKEQLVKEKSETNILEKMSEKFCLKTAGSLLPMMDDSESTTNQLIDSIELYDSLLDDNGKKLLTTFVLKTRLSQSAKMRLKKTYDDNQALIFDIKFHLLTKKSPAALSIQLSKAKQGNKSVDSFGKSLEEMFVDLTIAQADGDDDAIKILSRTNEKIAINAFANGLQSSELRTIIKSRNYTKLNEAIRGAKDEEIRQTDSQHVFHMRGGNRHFRGHNRKIFSNKNLNFGNRGNQHNYPRCNMDRKQSYSSYTHSYRRGRDTNNSYRGRHNSRNNRNFTNSNTNHRTFLMSNDTTATDTFFRVNQERPTES